jgi:hypothetical protein
MSEVREIIYEVICIEHLHLLAYGSPVILC